MDKGSWGRKRRNRRVSTASHEQRRRADTRERRRPREREKKKKRESPKAEEAFRKDAFEGRELTAGPALCEQCNSAKIRRLDRRRLRLSILDCFCQKCQSPARFDRFPSVLCRRRCIAGHGVMESWRPCKFSALCFFLRGFAGKRQEGPHWRELIGSAGCSGLELVGGNRSLTRRQHCNAAFRYEPFAAEAGAQVAGACIACLKTEDGEFEATVSQCAGMALT